ncbi:MAG: hypothetical protein AAB229_01585 [Candidatus Hydrogenedentota bacterium]
MIEKSLRLLDPRAQAGTIGHCYCAFRCAGCPHTTHADALHLRIVGYDEQALSVLQSFHPRATELAAGEISASQDTLEQMKKAGLQQILIPLFGTESVHDERADRPGAYAEVFQTIKRAQDVGLRTQIIVPAELLSPEDLRSLTRHCWALQIQLTLVNSGAPPCFASRME